jgi:ATP-dependent DNA helicase RecG
MDEETLRSILQNHEDYDLEFKSSTADYSVKKIHDYCAAMSNENGGYLLLGVKDDRSIIGTAAFIGTYNKHAHLLTEHLRVRVKVYEVETSDGRVLIYETGRHVTGVPVQVRGGTGRYKYPIRDGESLVEMDQETLRSIFAEREDDWSAKIAEGVTLADLDPQALEIYRRDWALFSRRPSHDSVPFESMLEDLQLAQDGKITNAAVLLFGTPETVYKVVPDAEIIFEWRNNSHDTAYGVRKNWRSGFMSIKDEIWSVINARNTVFRLQDGFTQRAISSYDEESIRESIVNAFAHRDYQITGRSIVIKVSPDLFHIENPGRLMPGVTLDNILDKSVWRNRLLAESLEKVNIMERSSQGLDKIFRHSIEAGKGSPTIKILPDPSISLDIPASLKDQSFITFLEAVSNRFQISFSVKEIIELEEIRAGKRITPTAKDKFLQYNIIERIGRGRGTRYILSHQFYESTDNTGSHIRLAGLSRDVKRNIVMEHLKKHKRVTNDELQQAMLDMDGQEVSTMLKGMARDGLIEHHGSPRWGHWSIKSGSKQK